jgi:hypothetical protein
MKPWSVFFVSAKPWLLSDMCIWAAVSWTQKILKCKSGGHLELWKGNRAPTNRNGSQKTRQLRPRCIGAARSRTQLQIKQSINGQQLAKN